MFLSAYVIGNVAFQAPIGWLLDRWRAGRVLIGCGAIQTLGALALPLMAGEEQFAWLVLAVWGGFLGGVYTTGLTMLGRAFSTQQLPAAMAMSAVCFEIGALCGPLVAGAAMGIWDPHGMLVVVGVLGMFLVWMGIADRSVVTKG
jgi:MFS family permease